MPKIQYKEINFQKKSLDQYGDESWELDALEPQMLETLIHDEVTALRDDGIYRDICDREAREKEELQCIADNYNEAIAFLESGGY